LQAGARIFLFTTKYTPHLVPTQPTKLVQGMGLFPIGGGLAGM